MNRPFGEVINLEGEGEDVEWEVPREWRPRPGANAIQLFFEAKLAQELSRDIKPQSEDYGEMDVGDDNGAGLGLP